MFNSVSHIILFPVLLHILPNRFPRLLHRTSVLLLLVLAACTVDYGEEPVTVYVRAAEPLDPYNSDYWNNIRDGQRVVFALRDYHEWKEGGSSQAFNEYAVRGTEMKYWIYLDDLDERGTLGFQLDVVAYGDTVHTETFSLEDDRTNPEPGRPNYRNGTFVWQW
jgi:hypothetical protein